MRHLGGWAANCERDLEHGAGLLCNKTVEQNEGRRGKRGGGVAHSYIADLYDAEIV